MHSDLLVALAGGGVGEKVHAAQDRVFPKAPLDAVDRLLAGLLALVCPAAYLGINVLINAGMLPSGAVMTAVKVALAALFVILRIAESMKLAKVFGKKAGTGILLLIFATLGRLFLGLGKAKYVGKAA